MLDPLEVWAGLECTVNRVGDQYFSQFETNGHWLRDDDLTMVAGLGIKKMRDPILWETVAPNSIEECDFSKSDMSLKQLRDLGVEPIAGLIHHGSGPKYTSLLDPQFPEKLAQYAGQVARRYPWINIYTPVNEPLTTARFSALYGQWYPHHRSLTSFFRSLINQTKATVLAMQAIRKVNPRAELLQTEDVGKILATSPLQYQADYENERRWLSLDLLFGWVDKSHYFYQSLTENGIGAGELEWLIRNSEVPQLIGINHYPLSNRFLDHRLDLYPPHTHGGNGTDNYADVGAVDTGQVVPPKAKSVILETWQRYQQPMVVSEIHIGGGREAQMRWLLEIVKAVESLRKKGADIRAVTSWSALGSHDWVSLCTRCDGHYEPGAFDIRAHRPRPTAIATMIKQLCAGRRPRHPLLTRKGYWHEPSRILFAPSELTIKTRARKKSRPVVITGASGTLGQAFARVCERRGIDYILLNRRQMDIASIDSVTEVLTQLNPWAVINTAGYVRVDDAETEVDRCNRENLTGPQNLAVICARQRRKLLTFSTDLVFDGVRRTPYHEGDRVAPLNVYGRSKAKAEKSVLELDPQTLVIRTSAFFSPWDVYNFVSKTRQAFEQKTNLRVADDVVVSPTYVPDLVWACLDLLADGEKGLLHLANKGALSWAQWARWVADLNGVDRSRVIGCSVSEFCNSALRPRYSVLESERVMVMPSLDEAMGRYQRECAL